MIHVNPPESVQGNSNVTYFVDVKKVTIQAAEEKAEMNLNYVFPVPNDLYHYNFSVNGQLMADFKIDISMNRKLSEDDIKNSKEKYMPGFRLTWYYNVKTEPLDRFSIDIETREFVRYLNIKFIF